MLNNRVGMEALSASAHGDASLRLLGATSVLVLGVLSALGVYVFGPYALVLAVALPLVLGALLDARFALGLVVLSMTVLGSELRVYSVRLIDLFIAIGLLGLLFRLSVPDGRIRTPQFGVAQVPALLLMGSLTVAVLGAVARDTPGYYLSPDLHAVLMPVGIFFLVRAVLALKEGAAWVLGLLLVAIVGASLKAIFLSVLGGGIAEGPESLWQAYVFTESFGTKRVILVGADTLIALGPAVIVAARNTDLLRNKRWIAALAVTGLAVAAGGTRTNIAVGIVGVALALGIELMARPSHRRAMLRALAGVLAGAAVLLAAVTLVPAGGQPIADGVTVRFTNNVLDESSQRFRENEQERVLEAVEGHTLFGLGAGGTYFTQTSPYTWEQTLWAHNGFLWVYLKAGAVGFAAFALGLVLLFYGLWRRRLETLPRVALVLVLGMTALSVTTNRLTDIGGSVILAIAFAVLSSPAITEEE
jgi:O-antigen ligase